MTTPPLTDPRFLKSLIGSPAPIDTINAPALTSSIAAPETSAPSLGSSMTQPVVSAFPTQTQTDMTERNRRINSGDGISQIHNPLLKGIARAADIAGSVFAPNLAMAIPGTSLHHDMLVNQATRNVANDQAQEKATADVADSQAQTQQRQAQTNVLENPRDKFAPVQTDSGLAAFDPSTGKASPVLGADGSQVGAPVKAKTPEQAAYEAALAQGMKPLEAFTAINQAKNTKDASFQQQFLDAYRLAHPEVPLTDAISATIRATSTQPKIDIHQAAAPAAPNFSAPGGAVNPTIQAYIDGRIPAPNARTKQGAAIMQAITAVDPTYDASRYNTYQAMQKEMTSGKTGASINSLNTIQEHIDRALKNMPDNTGSSTFNWLKNTGEEAFGGNPTGKYEVDATGIAGEWGKLVAGGVASEGEQKHVQALLSPNASPQKMKDNLAEVKAMTDGKLKGIKEQIASAAHPGSGNNPATSLPQQGGTMKARDPQGKLHEAPAGTPLPAGWKVE